MPNRSAEASPLQTGLRVAFSCAVTAVVAVGTFFLIRYLVGS